MRVLVPGALRRQNQIAIFHDHLLAIDVGVSAMAVQDESKCGHRVPVCRRDFAGLNELKRKQDRVAGHLGFRRPGLTSRMTRRSTLPRLTVIFSLA